MNTRLVIVLFLYIINKNAVRLRTTFCAKVAGALGLEPRAYGFGDRRVIQEFLLRRNGFSNRNIRFITILLQSHLHNILSPSVGI